MTERRVPPVAELATVGLALVVVGGIWMASHLPREAPLALPIALLAGAVLLIGGGVAALTRVPGFAWERFKRVGSWALLAYAIVGGMLEYVFVLDGTRGAQLVVLTLMLLVFVLDVPLILAFSVARWA